VVHQILGYLTQMVASLLEALVEFPHQAQILWVTSQLLLLVLQLDQML
jgi:hypothetical protein